MENKDQGERRVYSGNDFELCVTEKQEITEPVVCQC